MPESETSREAYEHLCLCSPRRGARVGVTPEPATADESWAEHLEWCANDCSILKCPKDVIGLVIKDPQTVLGAPCPRKALIALARQAVRAGQGDKGFALARACHCHNPLAQENLESNKQRVIEWLKK